MNIYDDCWLLSEIQVLEGENVVNNFIEASSLHFKSFEGLPQIYMH